VTIITTLCLTATLKFSKQNRLSVLHSCAVIVIALIVVVVVLVVVVAIVYYSYVSVIVRNKILRIKAL